MAGSSLLVVAIGTLVGGEELATRIVEVASEFLAPEGQDALREALLSGRGRGGATVVGPAPRALPDA